MAVTAVEPDLTTWRGTRNRQNKNKIITRHYALLDDPKTGPDEISVYTGPNGRIPQPSDTYSHGNDSNSALIFGTQDFPARENQLRQAVDTTWENRPETSDDETEQDNAGNPVDSPLDAKDRITMTAQFYQAPAFNARNLVELPVGQIAGNQNRPINTRGIPTSSAGQPFNPPVMRDYYHWVLRIAKNLATVDMDVAEGFVMTMNSDALTINRQGFFFTIPVNAARMVAITPEPRTRGGFTFWTLTYEMHVKPQGVAGQDSTWVDNVQDQGTAAAVYVGAPRGDGTVWTAQQIAEEFPAGKQQIRELPGLHLLDRTTGQPQQLQLTPDNIPYEKYDPIAWGALGLWD